jgi:hypothetical protein
VLGLGQQNCIQSPAKNCKCFGFTGVEAGVNLVFGNALLDSNGGLHGFLVAS